MDSKIKNGHILGMKFMAVMWLLILIGLPINWFINSTAGSVVLGIGISCGLIGAIFYATGNIKKSNNNDDRWHQSKKDET